MLCYGHLIIISPNGKVLSDEGRQNYANYVDSVIKQFSERLELLKEEYTTNKKNPSLAYSSLVLSIDDLDMFATMTFIDCLIASKLFILAKEDYEKKYQQGKLQVVLNEGFKKLYGFGKCKTNSKWKKPCAWDFVHKYGLWCTKRTQTCLWYRNRASDVRNPIAP